MSDSDRELVTDQELAVALSELQLAGRLEWRGDEECCLTKEGMIYAFDLLQKHGTTERVAMMMFSQDAMEIGRSHEE